MCAGCNGKKIPVVAGATTVQGSVQTVQIGVVDGYYTPNKIAAKAGIPIQVVFSGKVKGCVGMPKFSSLGKQADFTSGKATLDLGALKAGTYGFTCKMGSNPGSFIVQ
jgi:plastocyanin domain-containing protein